MSAEVNIPNEALSAGWDALRSAHAENAELVQAYGRAVHAVAPLIVADALVEQADELYAEAKRLIENADALADHEEFARGFAHGVLVKQAKRLEARAAELRGESR